MISIYKASSTYEADIIKSVLEDNEIECFIQGYNHRSMLGFVGAYIQLDVMVDEADEKQARHLIDSIEFEESPLPEETAIEQEVQEECKQDSSSQLRNKFMRAIFFAFVFPGMGCLSFGLKDAGSWIVTGTGVCLFLIWIDIHSLRVLKPLRLLRSFYFSHDTFVFLAFILLMLTDMVLVTREYRRRKRAFK